MNTEDKKLLLEDFFARNMKAYVIAPGLANSPAEVLSYEPDIERVKLRFVLEPYRGTFVQNINEVKPLLFPVNKLTEENIKELNETSNNSLVINPDETVELSPERNYCLKDVLSGLKLLDGINVDHRGLIAKGLAEELTIDIIKSILVHTASN